MSQFVLSVALAAQLVWQPAPLEDARQTELVSAHTGHTYLIQAAALGAAPPQGYPVLYILDGRRLFPAAVTTAATVMNNPFAETRSPVLVVGIDYADRARSLQLRSKDYTPPLPAPADETERQKFGGAEAFSQFLNRELKPAVAAAYPVDGTRQALFGHSYGGLFAAYSLRTAPQQFSEYLMASPSLWQQQGRWQQPLPYSLSGVGVRISAGSLEQAAGSRHRGRAMIDNARRFNGLLRNHGIDSRFTVHEGENHGSNALRALHEGIKFLEPRWRQH